MYIHILRYWRNDNLVENSSMIGCFFGFLKERKSVFIFQQAAHYKNRVKRWLLFDINKDLSTWYAIKENWIHNLHTNILRFLVKPGVKIYTIIFTLLCCLTTCFLLLLNAVVSGDLFIQRFLFSVPEKVKLLCSKEEQMILWKSLLFDWMALSMVESVCWFSKSVSKSHIISFMFCVFVFHRRS